VLGRCLGNQDGTLMNGISALIKYPKELPHPFRVRTQQEDTICASTSRLQVDLKSAGPLIFKLPASRKIHLWACFLFFFNEPCGLWYFVYSSLNGMTISCPRSKITGSIVNILFRILT
jgi:hypothetical protein